MKTLVTGGAGFIGSNYVKEDMVVVDKLTYASDINNLNLNKINFYQADICDKEKINKIFKKEKPDIVINFAAESHVDNSIKNPDIFMQSNIVGVNVLLETCLKYGIRFHQISTDEVYGDTGVYSSKSFNEKDLLRPSSPYSASKASADMLVLSYFRTYGLPVTISRCTNNYGKYQYKEKFIPTIINCLHDNMIVPIYGTGFNIRDWINVKDHCNAIDCIIKNGTIGEIYNIGANNEIDNLKLVNKIGFIMSKPIIMEHIKDRKGHDRRYSVDCEKIKKIGWHPFIDFKEGLKDTVKWYEKRIEDGFY